MLRVKRGVTINLHELCQSPALTRRGCNFLESALKTQRNQGNRLVQQAALERFLQFSGKNSVHYSQNADMAFAKCELDGSFCILRISCGSHRGGSCCSESSSCRRLDFWPHVYVHGDPDNACANGCDLVSPQPVRHH